MLVFSVQDVQAKVISALKTAADGVGARLVLADDSLSHQPTLWLVATPEQKRRVLRAAARQGIRFQGTKGQTVLPLLMDYGAARTVLAYLPVSEGGICIHDSHSGIWLELPAYSSDTGTWRAARAGVEGEILAGTIDALPQDRRYGVALPQLRNAAALRSHSPARAPVDIVYTWVDGSDPDWQARKGQFTLIEKVRSANSATRFRSDNELLYSIRSVLQFFKGHGRIHVVTDRQVPRFLGDLLDLVKIVDHRDIFPSEAHLPTFNSHAIEAFLHRIPDLSENYLYLNDDVMFGRSVSVANFFDEYGRARYFPSCATTLPSEQLTVPEGPVEAAGRNNRALLQERLGVYHYRKYWHAPIAVSRETMRMMEADLPEAWERTVPNRIRSPQDHSIAGNLYFGYAAAKGRAVQGTARYRYFDVSERKFLKDLKDRCLRSERKRPDFFCVNETVQSRHTDANKRGMADVLDRLFPAFETVPRPGRRSGFGGVIRRWTALPSR